MNIPGQFNMGAFLKLVRAAALTSATAAGSGDNTLVTGTAIDRTSKTIFPGGPPKCLALGLNYTTTLASAETLTFGTVLIEHSPDNSTWATLTSAASGTVETGASGGSTNTGVYQLNANLEAANKWVRCKFTPDLSRGGTDTAQISAIFAFAGLDQLPNA